jgi:hypothetical protein
MTEPEDERQSASTRMYTWVVKPVAVLIGRLGLSRVFERVLRRWVPGADAFGAVGRSARLLEDGRAAEAFELCRQTCRSLRADRPPGLAAGVTYWMLVETVAASAADLGTPLPLAAPIELVEAVEQAPIPATGAAASRALERVSRCLHAAADAVRALDLARRSVEADATPERARSWAAWLSSAQ